MHNISRPFMHAIHKIPAAFSTSTRDASLYIAHTWVCIKCALDIVNDDILMKKGKPEILK